MSIRPRDHVGEEPEALLIVEVDVGSSSARGRPPGRAWIVRIRNPTQSVVVAIGLSHIAAQHLADHIAEVLGAVPDELADTWATTPITNAPANVRDDADIRP
jgi:hypothetical protein